MSAPVAGGGIGSVGLLGVQGARLCHATRVGTLERRELAMPRHATRPGGRVSLVLGSGRVGAARRAGGRIESTQGGETTLRSARAPRIETTDVGGQRIGARTRAGTRGSRTAQG